MRSDGIGGFAMAPTQASWSHDTTLEPTPISVPDARAFVSLHLIGHRLRYRVDAIRLVVSELATNALVHGRTPFVVTLSRQDDTIRLAVTDDSPWVASGEPDWTRQPSGHGLSIVNALSRDYGVNLALESTTVWALFDARRARST